MDWSPERHLMLTDICLHTYTGPDTPAHSNPHEQYMLVVRILVSFQLQLCEYVFVLISGVGYGVANYDFCHLQIVYIWKSGDS